MAIYPIYTYDAPVLREKTFAVPTRDDEVDVLIANMFETMKYARGVGLATNQVGFGHSIFVIDVSEVEGHEGTAPLAFVNPEITEFFGEDVEYEEGCLSIPDLHEGIIRPESLHIRYRDAQFEEREMVAEGFLARVIQHEFDHLQGIFFTDRLRGIKKHFVMPHLKKIMKGEIPADYPLAPPAELLFQRERRKQHFRK